MTLIISNLNAQNLLTIGEVFKFSIGDEMHYKINYYYSNLPNAERIKVIDKYYSTANDTVFYKFARDNYSTQFLNSPTPHLEYTFVKDTVITNYTNLDSSILFFNVSHRYDSLLANLDTFLYDTIIGFETNLCDKRISGYELKTGSIDFEPTIETFKYGEGIGLIYHDIITGGHPSSSEPKSLFYFKKSESVCGNPDVTTFSNDIGFNSLFEIYPIPVNETLYIDYFGNYFNSFEIKIYDMNGILVNNKTINENHYNYNLTFLKTGLYILQIYIDNKVYIKNILKN